MYSVKLLLHESNELKCIHRSFSIGKHAFVPILAKRIAKLLRFSAHTCYESVVMFFSISPAIPSCLTWGFLKAFTKVLQVGTPDFLSHYLVFEAMQQSHFHDNYVVESNRSFTLEYSRPRHIPRRRKHDLSNKWRYLVILRMSLSAVGRIGITSIIFHTPPPCIMIMIDSSPGLHHCPVFDHLQYAKLHFCIQQVTINWSWGRSGNEASI